MHTGLLKKILREVENGRRGVFCLLIERRGSIPRTAGTSMWVYPDGAIEGSIGGGPMEYESVEEARDMLKNGDRVRVRDFGLGAGPNEEAPPEGAVCGSGGGATVYFELLEPNNEVFIFGAGHVGKALSRFAALCEFDVTVWDDRPEHANGTNIPWARTICCPLAEVFDESKRGRLLHNNSYVVVVTRGHEIEMALMRFLAAREVAYIGAIGSRGKKAFVDERLKAEGVPEDFLNSVRSPVGLPFNAETPAEVALCIMSEIVAVKNGANAEALRNAK